MTDPSPNFWAADERPAPIATAPPKPHRGPWVTVALVAAVVVLALGIAAFAYLTGREDGAGAAGIPSAAPRNQVECLNVQRAFNAWDSGAPKTTDQALALDVVSMRMRMEDGKAFLRNVQGYDDKASKTLAVAVAAYNVELSLANIQVTAKGSPTAEQSQKLVNAAGELRAEHQRFRTATCT